MTVTVLGVEFDGINGTIQRPKQTVDYFTRFGDDKVYMTNVKSESAISSVKLWKIIENHESTQTDELATAHIQSVLDAVGVNGQADVGLGITYDSIYITDVTYTRTRGAGYKTMLEYFVTIVADNRKP